MWRLRRYQPYFSEIAAASVCYRAFLKFCLLVVGTAFFSNQWLLSHITIVKAMDRGVNPVTMTIINPRKEY